MDAFVEHLKQESWSLKICELIERVALCNQGSAEELILVIESCANQIQLNYESRYVREKMNQNQFTKSTLLLTDFIAQVRWSWVERGKVSPLDWYLLKSQSRFIQKQLFRFNAFHSQISSLHRADSKFTIKTTPLVMAICSRQLYCVQILTLRKVNVGEYELALAVRVGCVVLFQILVQFFHLTSIAMSKRPPILLRESKAMVYKPTKSCDCSLVAMKIGLVPCTGERCAQINRKKIYPMKSISENSCLPPTAFQLEAAAKAEFGNRYILEYAIMWNKHDIISLLLPFLPTLPTEIILKSLIRHGNSKTLTLILNEYPKLIQSQIGGASLLDESIERSSIENTIILYQKGCIPTSTTLFVLVKKVMQRTHEKLSPKYYDLIHAVACHPEVDIHAHDEWDRSVFDLLLRRNRDFRRHELQILFLKLGFDVNCISAGLSPIQVSILHGDLETTKVLLQYGPAMNPTAYFNSIEEMCPGLQREMFMEMFKTRKVPPLWYLCLRVAGVPSWWKSRLL
jgi:hypothetical protein